MPFVSIPHVPDSLRAVFVECAKTVFHDEKYISLRFSRIDNSKQQIYVNIFGPAGHVGHFDVARGSFVYSNKYSKRKDPGLASEVSRRAVDACAQLQQYALFGEIPAETTESDTKKRKRCTTDDTSVDLDCKVCYSETATHAPIDCGHMCVCGGCILKMKSIGRCNTCPLCRRTVTKYLRIYL